MAKKKTPQDKKREDVAERSKEARESGVGPRSFDRDDPALGWDAQQGVAPRRADADDDDVPEVVKRRRPEHLYADDPVVFTQDQLPDPDVLDDAGLDPVLPPGRVAGDEVDGETLEATPHDGGPQTANVTPEDDDDEPKAKRTAKKTTAGSKS